MTGADAASGAEQMNSMPVPAPRVWAGIGVLVLAAQCCVYTAWVLSGDAHPVPRGGDVVPTRVWVTLAVVQVVCVGILVFVLWKFVTQPWCRHGRAGVDAVFVLAWATIYFHDPIINYTRVRVLYNAAALNLGSWGGRIPGWRSDHGASLPEPLLVFFPAYAGVCFLLMLLGVCVYRNLRTRWPAAPRRALLTVWLFEAVLNLLIETAWMQTGLWVYPGAIPALSVFAGTTAQFPVYESVLFGAFVTVMVALRSRAGSPSPAASSARPAGRLVAALAVVGAANVAAVAVYDVPNQVIAPYEHRFSKQLPSYQTTGLCDPAPTMGC